MKKKVFMPGEIITTEEEFACGAKTFCEDGYVKAAGFGEAEFDNTNREVSLSGKKAIVLKNGDVVLGRVIALKDSMVIIELIKSEQNRAMPITRAQLAVRNISNAFVDSPRSLFKIGDIVKAEVLLADELTVDLTTKGKGLGVITAYCSNCRKPLSFSNGKMMCLNCNHVEDRKWFDKEDEFVRRPRTEGYSDRGRFDNRRSFGNRDSGPRNNFNNNRRNNFRGERR